MAPEAAKGLKILVPGRVTNVPQTNKPFVRPSDGCVVQRAKSSVSHAPFFAERVFYGFPPVSGSNTYLCGVEKQVYKWVSQGSCMHKAKLTLCVFKHCGIRAFFSREISPALCCGLRMRQG